MTAFQTGHAYPECDMILGNILRFHLHRCHCISSASAADKNLTFIFRIKIQQNPTLQLARLEGKRPRQTCLLINGKQGFQRAVAEIR